MIKRPRVRLSIRWLMVLVASVAVFIQGERYLIVGDGGVAIELVNRLDRPLKDIRLSREAESIVTKELPPGGVLRGRLWPAEIRRYGALDGRFAISFNVDGRLCQVKPSHTFDLIESEPNVRWNVVRASEPEAYLLPGRTILQSLPGSGYSVGSGLEYLEAR